MEIDWLAYGVDADSADFWDKCSLAEKRAVEREKAAEKAGSQAEQIRAYCAAFREFYTDLLGESAAIQLTKDAGDNRRLMDEIYASLLHHIRQQRQQTRVRMMRILSAYAPKKELEASDDTPAS